MANGPESLSDSIISELLESRQQQGAAKEKAESSSPTFGWQILCGRSGNAVNGQTLAEAVDIFTVCLVFQISDVFLMFVVYYLILTLEEISTDARI